MSEVSKQTGYVLLGEAFALAVPKQVDYGLMIYPFIDVAKQSVLGLLADAEVHVAKQVVYALLATPPGDAGPLTFTATGTLAVLFGQRALIEFSATLTTHLASERQPPWDCGPVETTTWTCN